MVVVSHFATDETKNGNSYNRVSSLASHPKYWPIITASATALKVRLSPWLGCSYSESFLVNVEVNHALTSASSTSCSEASEGL